MKLLVTGGAGFIGSNFIKYILSKYDNYHITNLDALTYAGNRRNLDCLSPSEAKRHRFIYGNINNPNIVKYILSTGIDSIINFAAESHVDRSITEPDVFVNTNICGTHTLLKVALEFNVKQFIQISTDEVYGSLGSTGVFTEKSPIKPSSPYSASKASADLLALSYYTTFGLPVMITRCSNNYGNYQSTDKLIPLLITNALQNKKLPIYGDGSNIRDWIHVLDHCSAIDSVLHSGISGSVYNIGSNQECTNIEMAKFILYKLNKSYNLIEYVPDRLGHDYRYAVNSTYLQEQTEWEPKYCINTGLSLTIDWYKNNESWWK